MNAFDGEPKLRPISSKKPSEAERPQNEDHFKQHTYNNYSPREHFYNNYNSHRKNTGPYYNKYFYENSNTKPRDQRFTTPSYKINIQRFNYTQRNPTPNRRNYAHPNSDSFDKSNNDTILICENNIFEKNQNENVHHFNNDRISSNWKEQRNYENIYGGFYRKSYHNNHNYIKNKERPSLEKDIFEKSDPKDSDLINPTQEESAQKQSTQEQSKEKCKSSSSGNKITKEKGKHKPKTDQEQSKEKSKRSAPGKKITKGKDEHKIKDNKIEIQEPSKTKITTESDKTDLNKSDSQKQESFSSKQKNKDKKKSIQSKAQKKKSVETAGNILDGSELQNVYSSNEKVINSLEKTKTAKSIELTQTLDPDTNNKEEKNTEVFNPTPQKDNPAVQPQNKSQDIEPFRQTLRLVPLHKLMYSTHESEVESTALTETYSPAKTNTVNEEDNVIDKILSFDKSKIKRIINYPSVFDDFLRKKRHKTYEKEIRRILETLDSEFEAKKTVDARLMSQDLLQNFEEVVAEDVPEKKDMQINDIVNSEMDPRDTEHREEISVNMNNVLGFSVDNFNIMKNRENFHPDDEDVKPNMLGIDSCIPLTHQNLQIIEAHDKPAQEKDSIEDVRGADIDKSTRSIHSERRRQRKRRNLKSIHMNEVVIVDSSSSSRCSLSSENEDRDSDSSHASVERRRQLKKKVSEKSVINSFDKLILPNINENLKERYRTKFSHTIHSKLHFISCVCTSNYNSEHFSKYEIAKIQRNINAEDNSQAIDFLSQQILNVFINLQKIIKKGKLSTTNIINSGENNEIQSDNNVLITSNTLNKKSVDVAENIFAVGDLCDLSKNTTICARNPNGMQLNVEHNQSHTSLNDLEKNCSSSEECEVDDERSLKNDKQKRLNKRKSNNDNWLSTPTKQTTMPVPRHNSCMESMFPQVDINLLKQNSFINDNLIMNIREIDMKLVEIHRRQLFIDEMIMKLQKDKMDVNLMATQLESEKYMLLNAALGANMMSNGPNADFTTEITPDNLMQEQINKNCIVKKRKTTAILENQHSKRINMTDNTTKNNKSESKGTSNKSKDNENNNVQWDIRAQKRYTVEDSKTQNKTEENLEVNQINDATPLGLGTQEVNNMEQEIKKTINQSIANEVDYSDIESGHLEFIQSPVIVLCTIENYIIAGTEDGNIYQYNFRTLKCELRHNKHCATITDVCVCPKSNLIYTTSLDGYLKISNIQNLKIDMQSVNLQEPLQTIDIQWDIGFIGSRWGNVFTYDIEANKINVTPLCSSNSSITSIKATNDGPRRVILVSSRSNVLSIRDANTGLLLRTLHLPSSLRISSVLLDRGWIYCGSFKKEVYKFDFLTGSHLATLVCGNGAVSMDLYNQRFLLVGCYDGLIYILDTDTNKCIAQFPGSGRMVLTLKVLGDKVITSAKNKTLQIIDIPKHVVVTAMAQRTNQ